MPEKIPMSQDQIKKFFANEYSFCCTEGFSPLLCIAENNDEYHVRTPLGDGTSFTPEHKTAIIEKLELVISILKNNTPIRYF